MEHIAEGKRDSGDQESFGTSRKTSIPKASPIINLQERFTREKQKLSYADFHHEITENAKNSPSKASINHQKEYISNKNTKEDEIVKYMSNLPSFLERGRKPQEKVFNFGVLDWGRLEKWQDKQIPSKSNKPSSFSIDGSTSHYRKGCDSPARQRMRHPSLQSHLITSSPTEGHLKFPTSFEEHDVTSQDHRPTRSGTLNGQGQFIKTNQHSSINPWGPKLEHWKKKDPKPNIVLESKPLADYQNEDSAKSCANIKLNIQYDVLTNTADKLLKPDSRGIDRVVNVIKPEPVAVKKPEPVVVLLPRDLPTKSHSGVPSISDSRTSCQRSSQASQNCSVGKSMVSSASRLNSDIPSRACQSNPSKARAFQGKKSEVASRNSFAYESSGGLDSKASKCTVDKVRSSSPFSRLMVWRTKSSSSSSVEKSDIPEITSATTRAKFVSDNSMVSSCLDNSNIDRPRSTAKSRSSPLKRLLDPLLKPKTPNCHPSMEPLLKDSIDRARKSDKGISDSSTGQSRKVKLDMSRCRKVDADDPARDKKHGPSIVHALLQVAVKNDLPLFTFAVDNVPDVLVATMITSSEKEKKSRVYAFFTVQEAKKKNASWLNQGGGKGKGNDYIPNVVAQLKVSEPQFSNFPKEDGLCVREFVLHSVDIHLKDELAAIVVKIPEMACNDLPKASSKECSMGVKSEPFSGREACISTTVILPSGTHSLPSKGGPSSLIERWRSGGSCDCGGWDIGCKLTIIANCNQPIKESTEPYSVGDQFELFSQGGVEENQPVFTLATLKDRIYSVEFSSSVSILQAFSICIANFDRKNPCELLESRNSLEEIALGESGLVQNNGKISPKRLGKVSAEYVSYPPVSPFGRV